MLKTNQVSDNITIQAVPQTEAPSKEFSLVGHALIAKEAVENPLGGFFPNQSRLLFQRSNDGAEVIKFGCNLCLEILPTSQGVGIHIGRIHNERSKIAYRLDPIQAIEQALEHLKTNTTSPKEHEKVVAERDYWKRKAQQAERNLKQLEQKLKKAEQKLTQIRSAIAP